MSAPPLLLALPRELRDQIYGYVYHEKRFNWGLHKDARPVEDDDDEYESEEGSEGEDTESDEVAPKVFFVTLTVHNSPCVGLLLAHHQLHDEYRNAVQQRELSISVYMNTENRQYFDTYDPGLNTLSREREAAAVHSILRQAKVLTLIWEGHGIWDGEPMTAMKKAAPNLSVFRLAVIDRITDLTHANVSATSAIDIDVDIQIVLRGFAQRHPPTPGEVGFPMSQCCKAFRLGYDCHHISSTWPHPKSCTISHIVHDVGLSVFEREETTSHNWKRKDLVDLLPLEAYPKDLLEALPPDLAEKLEVYPFKMLGWKELDFNSGEK